MLESMLVAHVGPSQEGIEPIVHCSNRTHYTLKPCPHLLVGGPVASPHQQGATFTPIFGSSSDWAQRSLRSPVRKWSLEK
jgi:hypothetical protein